MSAFLTILTFHSIDGQSRPTSFSPQVFARSMAKLKDGGYGTLSLAAVADCLRQSTPFPDRSLVITFDDGCQSVYDEAFPVLQRHGLSATVFLTVGKRIPGDPTERLPSLEGRLMLAWREILEMQRWGIEFGAHTLTHPDLTRIPTESIEIEMRESKALIEDELGTPVTCFAYPYGRYDARSHQIAERHFTAACADRLGVVTINSDRHALERVDAHYLRTDALFDLMFGGLFPWYVRGRSIPRRIRRAIQRRVI